MFRAYPTRRIKPTLFGPYVKRQPTGDLTTMNSIKCPNCGLVNFATATACKRCKHNLEDHSYPYWREKGAIAPPTPDWSKLQTVPAVPAELENLADYGDGSHPFGNKLFRIFLFFSIILSPVFLSYMNSSLPREIWKLLVDQKSKYYLASFEPLYYLALTGGILFPIAAVILLITLSLKVKIFLRLVVIYLVAKFIYYALEMWLIFRLDAELREKKIPEFTKLASEQLQWIPYINIIFILIAFLWFRYFTTNKRARAVFE